VIVVIIYVVSMTIIKIYVLELRMDKLRGLWHNEQTTYVRCNYGIPLLLTIASGKTT